MKQNEEKIHFANSDPNIYEKSFLPAQIINTNEKESVILEYDGVTIEACRTNDKNQPLLLYVAGSLLASLKNDEKKILEFNSANQTNSIKIWNARNTLPFFTNFIFRDGIALTINDKPVKGTLADPRTNLWEGRIGIIIFLVLVAIKIAIAHLINNWSNQENNLLTYSIYIIMAVCLVSSLILYAKRPYIALWLGLVIGSLETMDYIVGLFLSPPKSIFVLFFWGVIRVSSIFVIYRSLNAIKTLLRIPIPNIQSASPKSEKVITKDNEIIGKINTESYDLTEPVTKQIPSNIDVSVPYKSSLKTNFINQLKEISPRFKIFFLIWFSFHFMLLLLSENLEYGLFYVADRFVPISYFFNSSHWDDFISDYDISEFVFYNLTAVIIYILYTYLWKRQGNNNRFDANKYFKYLSIGLAIIIILVSVYFGGNYLVGYYFAYQNYNKAVTLIQNNDYANAILKLKEAISWKNDYAVAHFELAKIYLEQYNANKEIAKKLEITEYGNISLSDVLNQYRLAISFDSSNYTAMNTWVSLVNDKANCDDDLYKAVYLCKKMINDGNNDYEIIENFGYASISLYWCYSKEKLIGYDYLDKAISVIYTYVEKYDNHKGFNRLLGILYHLKHNHKKAIAYFERELSNKFELTSRTYSILGESYYKIGNEIKAIKYYTIAANLGDEDAILWFNSRNIDYHKISTDSHQIVPMSKLFEFSF